jgi:hypothetical protein
MEPLMTGIDSEEGSELGVKFLTSEEAEERVTPRAGGTVEAC